jgi:hypothetical protein
MSENDSQIDERQETLDDVETPSLGEGAVLASSDWTTQTIIDQLRRGNIDLNPIFQRRDAWRPQRKSQFIESLVLGLPVPQLVLAERREKRGTFIIIDGKQRLLTLRQFAATGDSRFQSLKLQGLRVLPQLNGLTYEDLRGHSELDDHLTTFENQPIRTVVIRAWPSEDFLYTVFLRLNTGSLPLSPQELRQALHPGKFTAFVNDYAEQNASLRAILGLDAPDFRMRDTELVIRFLGFRNFLSEYTGNLKPLLDKVVEHFNKNWDAHEVELRQQLDELDLALTTTIEVFGTDNAFRKWNGTRFEYNINRAVFDIMIHSMRHRRVADAAVRKSEDVVKAFKDICENDADFRSAVEGTTKSIDAIFTRLKKWAEVLSNVVKVKIRLPKLRDNRIILE